MPTVLCGLLVKAVNMDFANINLFSMMKAKMQYHAQRQVVLARNLSHIDTPNYQPQDLKEPDFAKMAGVASPRLKMSATSPGHIQPRMGAAHFAAQEQDVHSAKPTDNAVELEEQMMKMADNKTQYDLTTNMYRKMVEMFRIATGNRQ